MHCFMYVIIAFFADNDTWEEIQKFVEENYKWFKSFLQMTGGVPKADSYKRIMGLVDHEVLNYIILDFFNAITLNTSNEDDILSLDGRLNNGSKRKKTVINEAVKPLNYPNIYYLAKKYCINTIPIDSKTNEIPTIRKYLKDKNFKGKIIFKYQKRKCNSSYRCTCLLCFSNKRKSRRTKKQLTRIF